MNILYNANAQAKFSGFAQSSRSTEVLTEEKMWDNIISELKKMNAKLEEIENKLND